MTREKEIKDALKYLVSKKASGILAQPEKLDAWLSDLVPYEADKIRLLVQASQDHHLDELSNKISQSAAAAALSDCALNYAYNQVTVLADVFSEAFSLDSEKITPRNPEKKNSPDPVSPFVTDSGGVLMKYNGSDNHVIVPDHITEIGDHAFEGNKALRTVVEYILIHGSSRGASREGLLYSTTKNLTVD